MAPELKILSRDEILGGRDTGLDPVAVYVPQWGGSVYVRGMSGTERDRWEADLVEIRGRNRVLKQKNIRASLAARTVVGADGKRLFSDDDILALGRKSAAALNVIFAKAQELSGVSDRDVDELAGESESGQSDESG